MISSTSLWFAAGVNVMILYPPCKKRRIIRDEEHTLSAYVSSCHPLMSIQSPFDTIQPLLSSLA